MKIKIHNDGKQKSSSFRATIDIPELCVFGDNEMEVLSAMAHAVHELIDQLTKFTQYDEENCIHVDYKDDPI